MARRTARTQDARRERQPLVERIGSFTWKRLTREPVLALGVIQAAMALAVGFGLRATSEQISLLMAFSAAILGFIARQRVRPS